MVLHRSHHGRRPTVDAIIRTIDGALDRLRSVGAFAHGDFLSFFIGTLHLPTGRLDYVNAGHPEAFVVRDGRAVGRLKYTSGSVGHLALIGADIEVGTSQLEPDDLVFVYTDGASEMLETETGSKAEGVDRLAAAVESAAHLHVVEVLAHVKDFLQGEAGEAGFDDDVTLMALRFQGLR
jgi:sigma-B regulation protein RsbU (phosphoserine phosphatase)